MNEQSSDKLEINENLEDNNPKNSRESLKVSFVAITVVNFAVTWKKSPSQQVLKAWIKTFDISKNEINKIFAISKFFKTIQKGIYTTSIDIPYIQTSFIISQNNDEAKFEFNFTENNLISLLPYLPFLI